VVVKITAWDMEKCLGSTLAEGHTVEQAEEKGIYSIKQRISNLDPPNYKKQELDNLDKPKVESNRGNYPESDFESHQNKSIPQDLKNDNVSDIHNNDVKKQEPKDWTSELTMIDYQLDRLKWERETENKFIHSLFSVNDRSRILSFYDIKFYLVILKQITNNDLDQAIVQARQYLIKNTDRWLLELNWSPNQARDYLKQNMQEVTRSNLSFHKLYQFNRLLEQELRNT
tara:strand:- start:4379 stop:5062 length:684 start_codon:yes stop_codon:yes gene_type:complete